MKRASGVLLHPVSLPGTAGIGTLGKYSYKFVDWLCSAGQSIWQVLPIGPTGYGDSPYASFSTFAGNPLLIDIETLVEQGFLTAEQAAQPEWIKSEGSIDYCAVVYWKIPLLKAAAASFLKNAEKSLLKKFDKFKKENEFWLHNFAVFMSIKEFYDKKAADENVRGAMWSNYWPKKLAVCNEKAVAEWAETHLEEIEVFKTIQFFFFTQWMELKEYANRKGISIVGDIPIFVAADSADVWANQKLFQLDKSGKSTAVAGVPPDYFSVTGQLWGNPLYNWKAMEKDGFAWWIQRIKANLRYADYIRIDHFRGFEAYWSVPAGEETAVNGKWIKGPDHKLFSAIKAALGDIPIIAEDLGVITDEVRKLRDDFCLPGMKILQFAFGDTFDKEAFLTNAFLPHMYSENCVVYTGTHDNDTLMSWLGTIPAEQKHLIMEYLNINADTHCGVDDSQLCDLLIREAFSSVARFAVIPMQDILHIGTEGRMNTPSTSDGRNWVWRMSEAQFSTEKAEWLKRLSHLYGRNITAPKSEE